MALKRWEAVRQDGRLRQGGSDKTTIYASEALSPFPLAWGLGAVGGTVG